MPTADIGNARASLELFHNAAQRRQPLRDQVSGIVGTEKPLRPLEHLGIMLMPANASSGAEGVGDLRLITRERPDNLECSRQKGGAIILCESKGLLRRQRVSLRGGIVVDITTCSICIEPFASVALVSVSLCSKLRGSQRTRPSHGFVKAQLVADNYERGVH